TFGRFAMDLLTGFEKIVRRGEPLAMHTWFQLGGPADYFAEPRDPDQLMGLIARCRQEKVPGSMIHGKPQASGLLVY
ncbi:MAG: hypothetical protein HGA86_04745, partial [Anaerolineaceae bacterium]|nr:hypothetical protein [Anaerolineaceae bacterium]